MHEKDILRIWDSETQRAIKLGNWYHDQRESDMLAFNTIQRDGVGLPIIKPLCEDGVKVAPKQKLEDGVYPEHLVYLKSARICGQADLVEVVNGKINITDYKTNKEIKETAYTNWEGITSKMFNPLGNLDDCNLMHYNIQLSIYAYIIQKHNPKLKVGKLIIQHVKFKQLGLDENGYPINELINGEPVIDKIKIYELPYLKNEVVSLIMWLKDNKI
jgi:ATP-dependent exoDNAse (exonuclease V) beta subunit